jgi:hypothetical protein
VLTYNQIKNAWAAQAPYTLFDKGSGLGLYLLVNPSGSKLWRLKYSDGNRRRLKGLGSFPEVSLQEARLAASAFRKASADKGSESGKGRQVELKPGFRDIASEWAGRFLPGLASKTRVKNAGDLERLILPVLGDLSLA